MIRVVLDTNIIVSAVLQPLGPPAQVFLLASAGVIQMCVSEEAYAEYEEVIQRPRLKRDAEEIEGALRTIREKARWVKSTGKVKACSDPDDDIFVDCAQAAEAHYLVTGNQVDFPETWGNTRIVTPRQFLEVIAEIESIQPPA